MTISLPKDLERFVHDAVRAGHYAREDDVVLDALARLKQAVPADIAVPGRRTKKEFHRHLVEIGLMSGMPDTDADFEDPDDQPIEIEGEPLSETVIRERR